MRVLRIPAPRPRRFSPLGLIRVRLRQSVSHQSVRRVWKKTSEVYHVREMHWILCDFAAYYGPHLPLKTSEVWLAAVFNTFSVGRF